MFNILRLRPTKNLLSLIASIAFMTSSALTQTQTNAAFGTIQTAQVDPRRAVLSARFRF